MNILVILLSATALSVLIWMTLAHVAQDMPWVMRLLARSQLTDLVLHFWIFAQFASSGHALIGAEVAGLTMSFFFWRYRQLHSVRLNGRFRWLKETPSV